MLTVVASEGGPEEGSSLIDEIVREGARPMLAAARRSGGVRTVLPDSRPALVRDCCAGKSWRREVLDLGPRSWRG